MVMIKLKLDKERDFKFNLKAMKEYKKATGKDLFSMSEEDMGIDEFSTLIYVGLKGAGNDISQDEVDEIVEIHHMGQIMQSIKKEMSKFAPAGKTKNSMTLPKK